MLNPDDKMLISDPCSNCIPGHTLTCHDIYRPQPWPCIVEGCGCTDFTPPARAKVMPQKRGKLGLAMDKAFIELRSF